MDSQIIHSSKHSYTSLWRTKRRHTHAEETSWRSLFIMYSFLYVYVCVRTGSHKFDTSGQMRLGQGFKPFLFFIQKRRGKTHGPEWVFLASIYSFFPLTFVVSPCSFSPQAGSSVLFYVHVPGRFFFHVDSLSFASYLFVSSLALLFSLALSTSCYLSPSLTPSLNLSLSLSVSLRSLSLSLSPSPFSFPSLPLFLSRSLTRTHTHIFLSLRRTYTDSPTMLDFLSLSWIALSCSLMKNVLHSSHTLTVYSTVPHSGVFHSIIEALLWDGQPIISRR